jgi:hypothetical protein
MMLAQATINNTEQTVYTCPANRKAYVFLRIYAPTTSTITVKINNLTYFSDSLTGLFIEKFSLDAGDTIKVGSNSQINVFIDGMEV